MTNHNSTTAFDRVAEYEAHNIVVTPVAPRGKNPVLPGWQKDWLPLERLRPYFDSDTPHNIGVGLGKPSNDVVDVDLDAEEVRIIADRFLPETDAQYGRASSPRSHRWYRAKLKTTTFQDPVPATNNDEGDGRAMLLELRSTGKQSIAPGSIHPSGEPIEWASLNHRIKPHIPHIPEVDSGALLRKAAMLAAAAMCGRYYPRKGMRHDFDLALSAGLLSLGLSEDETISMVQAAAVAAGLSEESRREQAVRDTARKIAEGEAVTGWPRVAELLGDRAGQPIVKAVQKWLAPKSTGRGATQASVLRAIGETQSVSLFLDDLEQPYAAVKRGDHHETLRLTTQAYRDWLIEEFMRRHNGSVPGRQAVEDGLHGLRALARFRGHQHAVHLRVGEIDGNIWIDLGGPDWQGICVTAAGWTVKPLPPGMFRRTKGMLPLPTPVPGGSLDQLRRYVNVGDDDQSGLRFLFMVAWLVAAMNPHGPFPILIITSQQGTAKSSTLRFLRSMIDPHTSPLLSQPTSDVAIWLNAQHNWLTTYDNLSHVPSELSDSYCRVSTGGGYSKRALYTDDEMHMFGGMRPQAFTGIGDIFNRADLLDRGLLVHLPQLKAYRPEKTLVAEFTNDHPAMLGALCDAASAALANLSTTTLDTPPRMADFAHWIEAASPGLGWERGSFLKLYTANREEASAIALEGSPVGVAVQRFMKSRERWEGTPTELLTELSTFHVYVRKYKEDMRRHQPRMPDTARGLTNALERIAPNLRSVGIVFERSRTSKQRLVTLSKED